ncbi:hypothetical protein NMG60_11008757 [Bertholletia excelsa]
MPGIVGRCGATFRESFGVSIDYLPGDVDDMLLTTQTGLGLALTNQAWRCICRKLALGSISRKYKKSPKWAIKF